MRLAVVNPNTTASMTAKITAAARAAMAILSVIVAVVFGLMTRMRIAALRPARAARAGGGGPRW